MTVLSTIRMILLRMWALLVLLATVVALLEAVIRLALAELFPALFELLDHGPEHPTIRSFGHWSWA